MQGIKEIEDKYVKNEAVRRYNRNIIDSVINGQMPDTKDVTQIEQEVRGELNDLGNQRFFKPSEINWKKEFENIDLDQIEVEITGESNDTQAMLTTIDKALTIVANPTYQQNKQAQYLVNKALTKTGFLSPVELSSMPSPEPVVANPQGGSVEAPNVSGMVK